MVNLIDYGVTRHASFRPWSVVIIIVLGVAWVAIVTIVNVAAVGYELVSVTSTDFNASYSLWYERFIPRQSWKPMTRTCDGSIIQINEAVSTNVTSFLNYILYTFIDERPGTPINGLLYQNTALTDCFVSSIGFVQSAFSSVEDQVSIWCNTTAGQVVALSASRETTPYSTSLNIYEAGYQQLLANNTGPLNISTVLVEWAQAAGAVLEIIAPVGEMSILSHSVVANNLSSIEVGFVGMPCLFFPSRTCVDSIINTPADGSWTLYLVSTPSGSTAESVFSITFLPTGEISGSTSPQDLAAATNLLAPTINAVRQITGDSQYDIDQFFQLLNWVTISYYWILLYDFGQTAPTYYNYNPISGADFSSPIFYPSTNNLFVNGSLFNIYSSYLTNTIIPVLSLYSDVNIPTDFLPVDSSNALQPSSTTFLRSYSCSQREIKGALSATVSVIVADYAFIQGAYSVLVFCVGWWYKQSKRPNDKYRYDQIIQQGNCCEGCLKLMNENLSLVQLNTEGVANNSSAVRRY